MEAPARVRGQGRRRQHGEARQEQPEPDHQSARHAHTAAPGTSQGGRRSERVYAACASAPENETIRYFVSHLT